ncbi:hypothetical protein IscW_ISCW010887 [Ixodes scapularis]|uniref:Uncharacterized protein n=1 Tax=Ixodes scapularis TaxID=6945 RepID=B7Q535_IXOSC|nr:hypothetical protein IscW_ISCW010887 [Ixodes scapularis]|eukprot:XP_002401425.1 hypothetical protein IscW_ISCW010887 [Ixodes scapularis]
MVSKSFPRRFGMFLRVAGTVQACGMPSRVLGKLSTVEAWMMVCLVTRSLFENSGPHDGRHLPWRSQLIGI